MSDFSNAAEWDPGVASASRVDSGSVGLNSAFDLLIRAGKRTFPMRYVVTEFAAGRVVFSSHSAGMRSVDTVTVRDAGDRTEVIYDARINFRGIGRLADPLLTVAFRFIAKRAANSLERRLEAAH